MDYSKAFEMLNQKVEKTEKAEKAVHDNLYNKGYKKGHLYKKYNRRYFRRKNK